MDRRLYLIAMAAGHGTRMGASIPKQFLSLVGKPVLQVTIEKFIRACPGISVVTVLPFDYIDTWKQLCISNHFNQSQILVKGGITRFHSVKNALEKIPDGALVLIHDGVRPLVSETLIRQMVKRFENPGLKGLIPVLPATDTLKILIRHDDGNFHEDEGRSLDRSEVFAAQTPQIFISEDIKSAYKAAYNPSFTDDASVAANAGIELSFCEGDRSNIKITTPEDIVIAEALMRNKR